MLQSGLFGEVREVTNFCNGVGLCINKRYAQYCLPQINIYIYTILCIWKC